MKKVIAIAIVVLLICSIGIAQTIRKINLPNAEALITKIKGDATLFSAVKTAADITNAKTQLAIDACVPIVIQMVQDDIGVNKIVKKTDELGGITYFHVVKLPYMEVSRTQITEQSLADQKAQLEEIKAKAISDNNKLINAIQARIDALPTAVEE